MDRRSFIERTGFAIATTSTVGGVSACSSTPGPHVGAAGIGICDWNLGPMCDPEQIPKAREANLEGIQVSVGREPEEIPLRDFSVRERYLELGRQHEITFHSIAAGGLLNSYALATEPRSAVWVIDALEAAVALGASNVLMAFFGNGDLRYRNADGEFVNQSEDEFASYQLDEEKFASVVNTLKEIVPRAQDTGVVLGLENTITAQQNLAIIDQVGSEWLQIYYDVGNSTGNGYDVPSELRLIGNNRLCEVHLKDWNTPLLGSEDGMVDMPAAAAALHEIGYDKWLVMETEGRDGRFLEDTRANVAWAKQTFGRA
ncbi:sugar phosphate isomerase/epimerase family protein [Gemmatimonadota bacterium]